LAQLSVALNLGFGALVLLTNAGELSAERERILNLEENIRKCAQDPRKFANKNKFAILQSEIDLVRSQLEKAERVGDVVSSAAVRFLTFFLAVLGFGCLVYSSLYPTTQVRAEIAVSFAALCAVPFFLGAGILYSVHRIKNKCSPRIRELDRQIAKAISGG
jgi:hypothetical protein